MRKWKKKPVKAKYSKKAKRKVKRNVTSTLQKRKLIQNAVNHFLLYSFLQLRGLDVNAKFPKKIFFYIRNLTILNCVTAQFFFLILGYHCKLRQRKTWKKYKVHHYKNCPKKKRRGNDSTQKPYKLWVI